MNHIINTFIDEFCDELDIDRETLKSSSRQRPIAEKRMLLSYFLRMKIKLTYEQIGDILDRNHCSIIYQVKKIEDLLCVYPHVRRMYTKIYKIYEKYIGLYKQKKDLYSLLLDENTRLSIRLSDKEKELRKMRDVLVELES